MRQLIPVLFVLLLAQRAFTLPPPSSLEIFPLIDQLGSDRFLEREAASKKLEAFGERALPRLRKVARDSKDAEVRKRASRLVEVVERPLLAREEKKLRGTWQVV